MEDKASVGIIIIMRKEVVGYVQAVLGINRFKMILKYGKYKYMSTWKTMIILGDEED